MNLHFYSNTKDKICDVAFSIIPYGKAVLLTNEESLIKSDKEFSLELNRRGLRVSTVVLREDEKFCLSSVCGLFNFAEDFRLVITATRELYEFCLYFSKVREIPALILCAENDVDFALTAKIGRFSDLGAKGVCVDTPRHVFIQNREINQSLIFIEVLLKRCVLVEYNISRLLGGEKNNDFYTKCSNVLDDTALKDFRTINLKTAILNYRAGGELFDNGAPFVFRGLRSCSSFKAVLCAQYLCEELDLVFNGKKMNLPDYNARVVDAVRLFGVQEKFVFDNLKNQIKTFKQNKSRNSLVYSLLISEIKKLQGFLRQGILNYYSMGGENEILSEQDKKAGLLLGDLTENINLASLLRESGGSFC